MALVHVLARDFRFALNTGTDEAPNLVHIGGIKTTSFGNDSERTDDTTYDSAGRTQGKTVSRSKTITLEGDHLEDVEEGALDPGQEALEVLGDAVGYSSVKTLVVRYPAGSFWAQEVDAKVTIGGGGVNDNSSFSAELNVNGKPRRLTEGPLFTAAQALYADFVPGGQVEGGTTATGGTTA